MTTKVTILEKSNPSSPIAIGDWYLSDGELFYLVQTVPGCVSLVSVDNGNRQRDPIKVRNVGKISIDEFLKIAGGMNINRVNVEILVSTP